MRARRPRVLRERAAAARRASSPVAVAEKPARSASALWIPVISLVLGSALTLGTTVVAGRLSAADDRQREEDAFFREQRVTVYAQYSAALLTYERAMDELADSFFDVADDPLAEEAAIDGLLASQADLEAERATISIVGSTRMVKAAHEAYGSAVTAGSALMFAADTKDGLSSDELFEIGSDFSTITRCRVTYPRVDFQQTAQLDVGAIDVPMEAPPECEDNLEAY